MSEEIQSEEMEREVERGIIPDWYRDIYPDGERDGFYEKLGSHSLCYVERSLGQLVITFDNLAEAGHDGYDREAWASGFCNYNNWSHLGIFAQGPSWFRDERLIARLEKLRDDGFFAQFNYVTLAGASMGGFGALVFSALIPGANVIAFSPQSTLIEDLAPWENRYAKGKEYDWSLPYADGAAGLEAAGKVYVIYDPYEPTDSQHAARLTGDNVVHLRAYGFGHRSALFLRRLGALKPVMGEGVIGTLDAEGFARMIRNRGAVYLYKTQMENYMRRRGRDVWVPKLQKAFRNRRKRLESEQST
ncbi:hypothetical protein [Neptunicoccus cionae]|uniref:hypothetical protein n=1 Tax=Neptunicoccus cionae TaxID=2035344 RepID=UPI000C75F75E|nr:hypothetical protein [Amylibacter cionae]PLS20004.1 hypothetical protein C0U40_18525 [Amylibacter cionae]